MTARLPDVLLVAALLGGVVGIVVGSVQVIGAALAVCIIGAVTGRCTSGSGI